MVAYIIDTVEPTPPRFLPLMILDHLTVTEVHIQLDWRRKRIEETAVGTREERRKHRRNGMNLALGLYVLG